MKLFITKYFLLWTLQSIMTSSELLQACHDLNFYEKLANKCSDKAYLNLMGSELLDLSIEDCDNATVLEDLIASVYICKELKKGRDRLDPCLLNISNLHTFCVAVKTGENENQNILHENIPEESSISSDVTELCKNYSEKNYAAVDNFKKLNPAIEILSDEEDHNRLKYGEVSIYCNGAIYDIDGKILYIKNPQEFRDVICQRNRSPIAVFVWSDGHKEAPSVIRDFLMTYLREKLYRTAPIPLYLVHCSVANMPCYYENPEQYIFSLEIFISEKINTTYTGSTKKQEILRALQMVLDYNQQMLLKDELELNNTLEKSRFENSNMSTVIGIFSNTEDMAMFLQVARNSATKHKLRYIIGPDICLRRCHTSEGCWIISKPHDKFQPMLILRNENFNYFEYIIRSQEPVLEVLTSHRFYGNANTHFVIVFAYLDEKSLTHNWSYQCYKQPTKQLFHELRIYNIFGHLAAKYASPFTVFSYILANQPHLDILLTRSSKHIENTNLLTFKNEKLLESFNSLKPWTYQELSKWMKKFIDQP